LYFNWIPGSHGHSSARIDFLDFLDLSMKKHELQEALYFQQRSSLTNKEGTE
jgi:hypothetical protein